MARLLSHVRSPNRQLLDLVGLTSVMARTRGRGDVGIGLVDGPIALEHSDLRESLISDAPGYRAASDPDHGTFIAGMLVAARASLAPAICPACRLVSLPVFRPSATGGLTATNAEVAEAIDRAIDMRVELVNVGAEMIGGDGTKRPADLADALDRASHARVLVVAAAGNRRVMSGSPLTRHRAVIPIAGCDPSGRPTPTSNLSRFIGTRGLLSPAEDVVSLAGRYGVTTASGTSCATAL
jgi:subtilisin family serine protease